MKAHQALVHAYEYQCNDVASVNCHLQIEQVDRTPLQEYYYYLMLLDVQSHIYERVH